MHPLNWLSLSTRFVRLVRLPNSGGISPLNSFKARRNDVRLARPPSSGGSFPLNWFSARACAMTRPFPPVATPSHSPIGASLSQFSLFFQLGPPVAL